MKCLLRILASATILASIITLAAASDLSPSVKWMDPGPLTEAQRMELEKAARIEIARIATNVGEFVQITAFNDPPSSSGLLPPNVRVIFVEKGTGRTYRAGFYVETSRLKLFADDTFQARLEGEARRCVDAAQIEWDKLKPKDRKGTFDDFAFPHLHSRKVLAIKKAPDVIRWIGRVDVGGAPWRFFRCYYEVGTWRVEYVLTFGEYEAPSYFTSVNLADTDELELVKYQTNVLKIPTPRNLEAKISREKARELSDIYLKKYYRKNEVANLAFVTNRLYVATPNHAFTPQFKDFATSYKDPPTLMWGAEYRRTGNTFVTTPMEIHLDAGDGSMLGGWE